MSEIDAKTKQFWDDVDTELGVVYGLRNYADMEPSLGWHVAYSLAVMHGLDGYTMWTVEEMAGSLAKRLGLF